MALARPENREEMVGKPVQNILPNMVAWRSTRDHCTEQWYYILDCVKCGKRPLFLALAQETPL